MYSSTCNCTLNALSSDLKMSHICTVYNVRTHDVWITMIYIYTAKTVYRNIFYKNRTYIGMIYEYYTLYKYDHWIRLVWSLNTISTIIEYD